MPFITEEIWQKLPVSRTERSIGQLSYPAADARLDDAEAEAEMKPIVEAIDGLRTIRGESNLSPALRLAAEIQSADAGVRSTLLRWQSYLLPLAGLASVTVSPPGPKPAQAAADIRASMEIYVPLAGVVDLAEERARLDKELDKAAKEIAQIEKKFANPNFAARAPAEVVEKDKARITELLGRIEKLRASAARLAPSPAEPPAADAPVVGEIAPGAVSELSLAYLQVGLADDAARAVAAGAPEREALALSAVSVLPVEADSPAVKSLPAKTPPTKKPPTKKPPTKKPTKKKPTKKPSARPAKASAAASSKSRGVARRPAAKKVTPKAPPKATATATKGAQKPGKKTSRSAPAKVAPKKPGRAAARGSPAKAVRGPGAKSKRKGAR